MGDAMVVLSFNENRPYQELEEILIFKSPALLCKVVSTRSIVTAGRRSMRKGFTVDSGLV